MKKYLGAGVFVVASVAATGTALASEGAVVESGDTLFSLAKKHGTTVDNIKKENNLKNDTIYVGQKLNIPSGSVSSSEAYVNTKDSDLMLRDKANTNSKILDRLKNNTKLQVIDYTNKSWAKVKANGKTGFVHRDYISSSENKNNNSSNSAEFLYVDVSSGTNLMIREKENINSNILDKVTRNTKVEVISKTSKSWTKVKVNGITGYAHNDYLVSEKLSSSNTEVMYVNSGNDNLNVRSGPGTSNNVIGKLTNNTKVTIVKNVNENWSEIKYENKTGFIHRDYISKNKTENNKKEHMYVDVNSNSTLMLRQNTNTSSKILDRLSRNTKVEIIDRSNKNWTKVKVNGKTGYLHNEFLSNNKLSSSNSKTMYVNTNSDNLNVRSGPGTGNKIIGKLSNNSKVTVVKDANENWSEIKYENKTGFVHKDYLNSSKNNSNDKVESMYVDVGSGSSLMLREKASTGSKILDRLTRNTKVDVVSKSNKNWTKVKVNGKIGFLHNDYLSSKKLSGASQTNKKMYVNVSQGSNLNVREKANANSKIIDKVTRGTSLDVINKSNKDWYEVKIGNKKGYVSSNYLSNDKVSGSTTKKYNNTYARVDASGLNLRSGAGTNNSSLTVLSRGTEIQILEEAKGDWVKVKSAGKTGYVSDKYLSKFYTGSKGDSSSSLPNSNSSTETIEVSYNETINDIARKYSTTVNSIKKMNNLSSNSLYVGQKIKIDVSKVSKVFAMPSEGVYTSHFGPRWGRNHSGLDIAKTGLVDVKAAHGGVVTRSYNSASYGQVVFIEHNINGTIYETVYAHMRNGSRTVGVGDKVSTGTVIGKMGNTGNSTGQHLHFEVHVGKWNLSKSNAVNPLLFLK